MTNAEPKSGWRRWVGPALAGVLLATAILPFGPEILTRTGAATLHSPNWALWARLSWVLQLHVISALSALLIGTVILLRPKGRGMHKMLGWIWVGAMASTAVSSLFITGLNGSFYSFIHLLSGWTVVAMPMAIFAIRSRKVDEHRRTMTSMFVGGLLVAGALTFLPGRFMFQFFLG